jgi:hypothetical protein
MIVETRFGLVTAISSTTNSSSGVFGGGSSS